MSLQGWAVFNYISLSFHIVHGHCFVFVCMNSRLTISSVLAVAAWDSGVIESSLAVDSEVGGQPLRGRR